MPPRDDLLGEIQRLYGALMALPYHRAHNTESATYQALMLKIRALVDQRTKLRGDEMIVTLEKAPNFKT